MKKNILLIFGLLLVACYAFAAGPESQDPTIYFNATDQELSEWMTIRCVYWVSDSVAARDIEADDDMTLEDYTGNRILSKRAEAVDDGLETCFGGNGLVVDGLRVEDLDGGLVYVVRERR